MNIAINITSLESGHGGRGVGVYTKLLIEALQKYERNNSYSFFTRGQKVSENADIVHYPYFDPFFLTLPLIHSKPTVVTVHDVIPLVFPDKFPSGIRGNIKWSIQKQALKNTNRVITDSKTSKRDICRIVGLNPKDVDAVYLAPSPSFHTTTDVQLFRFVQQKYHLPKQFIVYVGDVNWNKNIIGLLEAFSRIHETPEFHSVPLVLIGKSFLNESLRETREINSVIEQLHFRDSLIRPGYVPDEDLTVIYSLARCLIQPSHYEGFGLPILEAMMCSCPVVAASNSSLREIAGPSIAVDDMNTEDIARGIGFALSLPENKRKRTILDGLEWAKSFSWKKTVHETVAAYEKVVTGS